MRTSQGALSNGAIAGGKQVAYDAAGQRGDDVERAHRSAERVRPEPQLHRPGAAAAQFGQITIDWDVPEPAVLLVVKMLDGQVAISRRVALAELKQRREPRAWEPSR